MNNSSNNKIYLDHKTLFTKIKEKQKLPDEIVLKFLKSKGQLKTNISQKSFDEKQS